MKITSIKQIKDNIYRVLVKLTEGEEKEVERLKDKIIKSKDFYWFVTTSQLEVGLELTLEEVKRIALSHESNPEDRGSAE